MDEGQIKMKKGNESDMVAQTPAGSDAPGVLREAEGEDVWGDLGAEEGLRPAPGRYQRSQRTTLPPYMSVAISNTSSAVSILALLVPYEHVCRFVRRSSFRYCGLLHIYSSGKPTF